MYGDSYRRRRRRLSYQAYLAGGVDEVVAAEVAAATSDRESSAMRAIGIGVATGVLTLLVNRFLERLLK